MQVGFASGELALVVLGSSYFLHPVRAPASQSDTRLPIKHLPSIRAGGVRVGGPRARGAGEPAAEPHGDLQQGRASTYLSIIKADRPRSVYLSICLSVYLV